MERSKRVAAYLQDVCAQVQWKQAHPAIARELADHIEDERQNFLAQGFPGEAAENQAIQAMGDALEVGRQFNAAYRPQRDWSVWIPFTVLLVFGFFARAYIRESFLDDYTPALLVAFFGVCFVPMGWLPKRTWLMYGVFVAALLGATWGVAPREFVRGYSQYTGYILLFLPVVSALLIYRMRGRGILGVCFICLAQAVIALVASQSSIGNYVLVAFAGTCLLLYAIIRGWFECNKAIAILIAAGPPVLLLTAIVVTHPHRFVQMLALVSPEIDPQGVGFVGTVAREILAKANFIGPVEPAVLSEGVRSMVFGVGNSSFENDLMLAFLSAKLGKVVFLFAVLALVAFVYFALRNCFKQHSKLGRMLSLAVVLTFAAQGAGYIAGNMGAVLLLRYPMPFVGIGNAAMLCNLILCGLLFSIFRTGVLLDDGVMQIQPRWKLKLVREL